MIRLIICAGLGIAGAATCVVALSHNKREREEYERKNEEYRGPQGVRGPQSLL